MKKEGWPDFPFFWVEKPDMSPLQDIASRLKVKFDSSRRSGFPGEATEMEKALIEHISGLHQQVLELNDALQASLQIIDDQRPSVKAKKALKWFRERLLGVVQLIRDNIFLTIVGAMSTLAFLITLLVYLFRSLKR